MFCLSDVSYSYLVSSGSLVLNALNIHLEQGEIGALVGRSGCGKTTALNIAAGFLEPSSGSVKFALNGQSRKPRSCMIFQGDALFPWKSVMQNILFGLHGGSLNEREKRALGEQLLQRTGLNGYSDQMPKELSGGMRKRVEIVRAIAYNPDLYLLDEPLASLDQITREEMQLFMRTSIKSSGRSALCVTHDTEEALYIADRVFVMTPRPGTLRLTVDVPFEARTPELKLDPSFLALRHAVLSCLREA